MSKAKEDARGFGAAQPLSIKKPAGTKACSDYAAKEKQATSLINQGKLQEAALIYKDLIAKDSKNHVIYGNYAAICGLQGKFDEMMDPLIKALKLQPNYPEGHHNLGVAFKGQGKLTQAIACFKKALELKPNYATAYNNLGIALAEQGNLKGAITSFRKALEIKPNNPEIHNNLGNSLKEKRDLIAAIACFKKALDLKPNYPEAHNNLGVALKERGEIIAAMASYGKAIECNPDYADAYTNLGNALKEQGEPEQALKYFQKALGINPEHANAFCGLGRIQIAKGEIKQGKTSLYRALEINPNNISAIYEISISLQSDQEALELASLSKSIQSKGITTKEASVLQFALANCFHKLQNFSKAAKHIAGANTLKLLYMPSDLIYHLEQAAQNNALTDLIQDGNKADGMGRIFIVGVPRCGSTLLETVLTTNPNIIDLGENKAMGNAIRLLQLNKLNETRFCLSDAYSNETKQRPGNFTYTVDKNLYNYQSVSLIARSMPSAKIIHCRRNPMDNILSMLRSNLQAGNNYTSSPVDAAKLIASHHDAIDHVKNTSQDQIYTFDYDEFVFDPESALKPLIKWLNLDWDERYLRPEKCKKIINTASAIQARQPISNASVGGWKNYLGLLKPAEKILLSHKLL